MANRTKEGVGRCRLGESVNKTTVFIRCVVSTPEYLYTYISTDAHVYRRAIIGTQVAEFCLLLLLFFVFCLLFLSLDVSLSLEFSTLLSLQLVV